MARKELNQVPTIIYGPPHSAKALIGKEEPRAKMAFTLINKETGETTIFINSTLPTPIQQVLLRHESVQLDMMQKYSSRGTIEDIMPYAHYAGLDAGLELAIELGVAEQYLTLRGQGETVESIRSAVRP